MSARFGILATSFSLFLLVGCSESPKANGNKPVEAKPGDAKTTGAPRGAKATETEPAPDATAVATKPAAVRQSAGAIDLKFIPTQAFAAFVAYPARVLADPAIAKLDLKEPLGEIETTTGVPPAEVEQMISVLLNIPPAAPDKGSPQMGSGILMRLSKPIDGDALVKKAMRHSTPEKTEIAGKTYFRPATIPNSFAPSGPAVYLIDDRTVLMGDEPAVKAMITSTGASSPLVDMLAKADATADLTIVMVNTDDIQKMSGGLASSGLLPPPLKSLVDAAASLSAVHATIKTSSKISLNVTLVAKDEAGAGKIAALMPESKQLATGMAAGLRNQASQAPSDIQPMLEYGMARIDQIVAALPPKQKGNELVMQVDDLGTLDELSTKLLVPGLVKAKAAAMRTQSFNNLKQLALAMIIYRDMNKSLPSSAIVSKEGKPLLSWRVAILPMIEHNDLYVQFHLDEPWDSEHNKPLLAIMPTLYLSPNGNSAVDGAGLKLGKTRYVLPVGNGALFDSDPSKKTADPANAGQTIMIVEVGEDKAVNWTQPDDMRLDAEKPLAGLGTIPETGAIAAFADGSVRALGKATDSEGVENLRHMFRAVGEPAPSK